MTVTTTTTMIATPAKTSHEDAEHRAGFSTTIWKITPRLKKLEWGWAVAVATSLLYTVVYGFLYSFGIIMVELMNDFGSSATSTGYVGTIAYGFSSVSVIVTAPLNARFGYRRASMTGLLFCVGSCVATSFSPSLTLMYFSHSILYGFGVSLMMSGGFNIVMSYFPWKHNSVATGIASAGTNAGVLAINPLVYYLITQFGWRNNFRIMAGVLLLIGVPCIMTFAPPPDNDKKRSASQKNADKSEPTTTENKADGLIICSASNGGLCTEKYPIKDSECGIEDEKDALLQNGNDYRRTLTSNQSKDSTSIHSETNNIITDFPTSMDEEIEGRTSHMAYVQSTNLKNLCEEVKPADDKSVKFNLTSGAKEDEKAEDEEKGRYWSKWLHMLRMPDLWCLEFGMMSCSVALSFLYFSMANVIITAGFSKKTASLIMSVMGLSELVGKIALGVIADRLPVPKVFILMAANCMGAVIMLVFSYVSSIAYMFSQAAVMGMFVMASIDSLPHSVGNQLYRQEYRVEIWSFNMIFMGIGGIFGAIFGESVDKTGSYEMAFYGNVAIFIFSAVCMGLAVVVQKFFAKDRYVMYQQVGRRYSTLPEINSVLDSSDCPEKAHQSSRTLIIAERVTCV